MPVYPVKKDGRPTGKFDVAHMVRGKWYRRRFRNEAEAYGYLTEIIADTNRPGKKKIKLSFLIEKYRAYSAIEKSYETNRIDQSRMTAFASWAAENDIEFADQITPPAFEEFKSQYLDDNKKNRNPKLTLNRYLELVKAMLNWAVFQGYMAVNPIARIKPLKNPHKRQFRFYSKDELKIIFKAAPPVFREYFQFLYFTGCREGEARYLEWSDLDLTRGLISIQSKSGFHPKDYQVRTSPIHPELHKILSGLPNEGRYVFGGENHAFSRCMPLLVLKNILRLNDLPDGRIHDFRHTFCSHLVESGADLVTVRDLAGHTSVKTTEKYSHSRPERRTDAIRKL
jgi:integrase